MSCYLNIKLFQYNPEGKFKFPWKNLNHQRKGFTERYYVTIAHQLILDFKLFRFENKKFPVTTVFWVYMRTLINLKRQIYSIKVLTFKYNLKLNATFSTK